MYRQQTYDHGAKKNVTQIPVAVVGIACRLPGDCNTPVDFWKFLLKSGCASCEVPPSRFDIKQFYDGTLRPNTMRSPGGMFVNIDPKDLDAGFFGLSQTDAISMDPNQRQLLEVVFEGLENAGLKLEALKRKKYGCFVGSYASDYSDMQNRDPEDRTPSFTIGAGRAMLSNRISHFLDITGPSMTIDTACSGSLVSVDLACRYLDSGDADGAIVAGCNLYLNPEHNMEQSAMDAAASRTGRCWTFDARADGYIKAEAINAIILKRLDDAIRDGDPIRAVLRGTSTNSDGWTPGIANPSADAQAKAIRRAYARSGIALSELSDTAYLECHGTGTQAGDPTEVRAASMVFAPHRTTPLRIGSVKSNIGHSEPAAGVSGMIKAVLSVESGLIPGNPTFELPNPNIDFKNLKTLPFKETIAWPPNTLRRISVNSFGFGGSNAHAIIEHPEVLFPGLTPSHVSSYLDNEEELFAIEDGTAYDRRRIFVLSANDDISLRALTKACVRHLASPLVRVSPIDLAYTLSERRTKHFHRAFTTSYGAKFIESQFVRGKPGPTPPRLGFVFTGQGAQWSQMGKSLIEDFEIARSTISRLEIALNGLREPPSWSLHDELVRHRSAEHMRSPEFSQPLVTALQLALYDVLFASGLIPTSVIGHSSGEIAAAAVSGHLTYEEAIKVAYLRGKLTKAVIGESMGMLAVGLSEKDIHRYCESFPHLRIGCINSPRSVTLSGLTSDLEEVRNRVLADGHFARLLLVDMAYHSHYMQDIARHYMSALNEHCADLGWQEAVPGTTERIELYSTVLGHRMTDRTDAQYWHNNMVYPVRFSHALSDLIVSGISDTLVELGPSGALSGPISQIIDSLKTSPISVKYFSTLLRGEDSTSPLYDLIGKMFLAGTNVDLTYINGIPSTSRPRVVIDLPNYCWNHNVKYWHEPLASIDWRFRKFPAHDLLGTKILGTSWQMPTWKRVIRLKDLPWLRDHQITGTVVFPAAAYVAMAVEAMFQVAVSIGLVTDLACVSDASYDLRNLRLLAALVLEEENSQQLYMSLKTSDLVESSWYHFDIQSCWKGSWKKHADGMVRIRHSFQSPACTKKVLPAFEYPTDSKLWYRALEKVGFNFGSAFQNILEYETRSGAETNRARMRWPHPEVLTKQSNYPIHPTTIDSFFQAGCPSVYRYRTSIDRVIVPKGIESITIFSRRSNPVTAITENQCTYTGSGRSDSILNRASHAQVYDEGDGRLLFKLRGLMYSELDPPSDYKKPHDYIRTSCMPDVTLLHDAYLDALPVVSGPQPFERALGCSQSVAQMLALAQHKCGMLSLLDVDLETTDSESILSQYPQSTDCPAFSNYVYTSMSPQGLTRAQTRMVEEPHSSFYIYDFFGNREVPFPKDIRFDVVMLRLSETGGEELECLLNKVKSYVADRGFLLLVWCGHPSRDSGTTLSSTEIIPESSSNDEYAASLLSSIELRTHVRSPASDRECRAFLCSKYKISVRREQKLACSIVSLSDRYDILQLETLQGCLRDQAISVNLVSMGQAAEEPTEHLILLLDHPEAPFLERIDDSGWGILQRLLGSGRKVLYVSCSWYESTQMPGGSLFTGLARTVRSEDPSVTVKTMEMSSPLREHLGTMIAVLMRRFEEAGEDMEYEYCEHNGLLCIPRLYKDDGLIQAERDESDEGKRMTKLLHANNHTVRMKCARVGTLDSLRFFEVPHSESELRADCVEVEIQAAALNFKDIATSMGLVAEDEYRLGSDGAGIIRRVGASVTDFAVGDRVITLCRGTFANRVQAEVQRCIVIPDSLSFEEAVTIPIVFFTVVYALLETTKLHRGQSILIHSATGGVGLACVQLSRYLGAKIYATVGSDKKRDFLITQHGVPPEAIFSSRSSDFYHGIMEATNGKGVDIVLNSLSGDLLADSWKILADHGTLIELGKTDIVNKKTLSMEPFHRNCTYRAIDIAQPSVYFDFDLIARCMSTILHLLTEGIIAPIEPRTQFSFSSISEAMKYMRKGTHMGKIVLSDSGRDIEIPVEPASPTLALEGDSAYLIVGGLRGLCGSLAVLLSQHGAKELVVMSRGGAEDFESRAIVANITALGANVIVVKGDVTIAEDVTRAFQSSKRPIKGIIQGAMILRDSTFESMECSDYHAVIAPKVRGTWNLHLQAQSQPHQLQFFTLLSSISGVIGSGGQANYAAGNAFLDAFAAYRHRLGLCAQSINLGMIEEVGYMSKNSKTAQRMEMRSGLKGIDERTLHRIVKTSIMRQKDSKQVHHQGQMITGLSLPVLSVSKIFSDARFCTLPRTHDVDEGTASNVVVNKITFLEQMIYSQTDMGTIIMEVVRLINEQVVQNLGLPESMEPAKSLNSYGIDSLAAVDLRNWIRTQLRIDLSTLDILSTKSLLDLAEKVTRCLLDTFRASKHDSTLLSK